MTAFSSVMDTVIFTLMAPVMMWFHSQFVVKIVLGQGVKWIAQRRKMEGVDWREAILTFGGVTLVGVVWGLIAWWIGWSYPKVWVPTLERYSFALWIHPIIVSLLLAIPLAILLGSRKSGRRFGLFLSPEEDEPPTVLSELEKNLAEVKGRPQLSPDIERNYGIMQVCLDPYVNGLHVSLLRRRKNSHDSREYLDAIIERFIRQGPQSLNGREINAIMNDTDSIAAMHYRLWSAAEKDLAPFWSQAIKQYNLAATHPFTHLLAQKAGLSLDRPPVM
jgi:membrane glycosyltransferase